MRVLMLGWEFPPFITGGLGTACYGLTRALDQRGVEVLFALPRPVAETESSHVRLLTPDQIPPAGGSTSTGAAPAASPGGTRESIASDERSEFDHVTFLDIPIVVSGAYDQPQTDVRRERIASIERSLRPGIRATAMRAFERDVVRSVLPETADRPTPAVAAGASGGPAYGGDLLGQVQFYAHFVLLAAARERFDVIHAHDWLTYPAALAIARLTGRPLVVHVHSTEFDRSGASINQRVYDIERRGMHGAMKVITVSRLTKDIVVSRYGVHPDKVEVVYNGVEVAPTQADNIGIASQDKIVLYFGRITHQKGPEYFIAAARRVLDCMDDVKFVVAGSGDQAQRMIEMAAGLGIGHKVLFTGFLRGRDIDRVFAMADVYVMPSISEPFGIAPLEAMSKDVPVIISKSSGVSEVLTHALKVDFWDTDQMADKIVAVLRHPPLSRTLIEHGSFEVRRITWEGAANRCEQVYRDMLRSAPPWRPAEPAHH